MQTKGFAKAAKYDDITKTLTEIKKQIGLDFKPCDHFTGVREFNGMKYFNVMLETRVSESLQYQKLLRFGKYKVEPNGVERVSIFL